MLENNIYVDITTNLTKSNGGKRLRLRYKNLDLPNKRDTNKALRTFTVCSQRMISHVFPFPLFSPQFQCLDFYVLRLPSSQLRAGQVLARRRGISVLARRLGDLATPRLTRNHRINSDRGRARCVEDRQLDQMLTVVQFVCVCLLPVATALPVT